MGKYFGTDGFRGEANKVLTVEHAYKVGRYLGWYFGRNKDHAQVVIGKDTRRSSYMLEYALVAGLTASGADVSLMHVTTTPSVAYITRTDGFDCGIMISASHNPYYDNGIKVLDANGHKMDAKVEDLIEKYIDKNQLKLLLKELIIEYKKIYLKNKLREDVNSTIRTIKSLLSMKTSVPKLETCNFKELYIHKRKIDKFNELVEVLKEPK